MYIIGITGGTGAGKTSALRAIGSLGAFVLDCDELYHELLCNNSELKSELASRFTGVLHDGVIDRETLGGIVFSNPDALLDLNAITHKYITDEIDRQLADWAMRGGTVAAIDAIGLIESGRAEKCDVVIGVTAPVEMRISRIMKRDGLTREQAQKRIGAQKPDSYFKEHCDHILEGNCDISEEFEEKCREFFKQIIREEA